MAKEQRRFKLVRGKRHIPLVPGEFLAGRSATAAIPIIDDEASRRHAILRVGPDDLEIEDLASANGTFVNGVRLRERAKLHVGDEVRIGRTVLMVDLVGSPNPERASPITRKFAALPLADEAGESGESFDWDHLDEESTIDRKVEIPTGDAPSYQEFASQFAGKPKSVLLLSVPDTWVRAIRRAAEQGEMLRVRQVGPDDAIAVAAEHQFGLLCIDVGHVGADAVSILDAWRAPNAKGPILIVSEAPRAEGRSLARALRADAYLERKTPPGEFLTCVRNLLQQ